MRKDTHPERRDDDPWDDPWAQRRMGTESFTILRADPRPTASQPTTADDSLALIIGLFACQFSVSVVAILASAVGSMDVDSCSSGNCNYSLISASYFYMLIGTAIVFVAAILFAGWRRHTNRRSWWVPLTGTVIEIGVFFLSTALFAAGLGFTLAQLFGGGG